MSRSESLVLTDEVLQQAYGVNIPPYINPSGVPDWTAEYPLEFRTLLPPRAGYTFHPGSANPDDPKGYFVNADRRRYDFQTVAAKRPRGLVLETLDPLHDDAINPLGHRVLVEYDNYQLLPEGSNGCRGPDDEGRL